MKKVYIVAMLILGFSFTNAQSIWMNPVTGTNPSTENPYTIGQVTDAHLNVSGIGRGPGISASSANNRYNASGWSTNAFGEEDYFYFSLWPAIGFTLNLASLEFTAQASGSGPVNFSIRSSLDDYATEIFSPAAVGGIIDLSGSAFQGLSDTISFRLYAWGSTTAGGTFSINDFAFHGSLTPGTQPTINLIPGSLEGFIGGPSFPSIELPYVISASFLVGDLTLTPSPGFEITTTSGSGYAIHPSSLALSPVGGIIPPTTVYVRLHATSYGPVQGTITHESPGASSQLLGLSGNIIAESPAIQGEVDVVSITDDSLELAFTIGNGTRRILLARQGSAVDALPLDGATYTAAGIFGTGDELGDGNFVVYAGAGNSTLITGLIPGTDYHFALFEYNDENTAGAENYLDALTGIATAVTTSSVVTYSWVGGDGNWSLPSNWSPARTSSLPTDILQFMTGTTITASGVISDSFGQLIVGNNTALNLSGTTSASFLINGLDGTDLRVDAGSILRLQDGSPITISLGNGVTGVINGSLYFSGEPHRLQAADASAVHFGSGSGLFLENGFSGNVFGNSSQGAFHFTQGSLLQQSSGATPFGSTNSLIFLPGSLFKYSGSSSPSFNGRNYADVEMVLPGANAITITGSSAVSIDNLRISAGTVNFNMTGSGHSIQGDIQVAPGASLNFLPNNPCSIKLDGTVIQTLTNSGTLSANGNIQFELDNPAGLELSGEITLANATLHLANGKVTLGNHHLALSSVTGADASRYIRTNGSGKLTLTAIGTDARLFPIGDSSFNPVTIASGNNLDWSVRVEDGLVVNDPTFAGNVGRAVQRNWEISHSSGSTEPGAELSFQYNDLSDAGPSFNTLADVRLWRLAGDNWIPAGPTQTPLGIPGGDRIASLVGWNTFSNFAIANVDAPLPVSLFNVRAVPELQGVKLLWQNLSELDVQGYYVERAGNGSNYLTIGEIPARSNNGGMESYEFFDPQPFLGRNFYRIRSQEQAGLANYSEIIMVDFGQSTAGQLLYPNPAKAGSILNLRLPELPAGKFRVSIVDILGRQVASKVIDQPAGSSTISMDLPASLRGIYRVLVMGSKEKFSQMLVVE